MCLSVLRGHIYWGHVWAMKTREPLKNTKTNSKLQVNPRTFFGSGFTCHRSTRENQSPNVQLLVDRKFTKFIIYCGPDHRDWWCNLPSVSAPDLLIAHNWEIRLLYGILYFADWTALVKRGILKRGHVKGGLVKGKVGGEGRWMGREGGWEGKGDGEWRKVGEGRGMGDLMPYKGYTGRSSFEG